MLANVKKLASALMVLLFGIGLSALVSGCAVSNHHVDQDKVLPAPLAAQFESGEIDFTCRAACSGRWGANRRDARRYVILEQWENLSKLVLKIGFNSDLSWYYLGRAAEGLNFQRAAIKYYARVLAISKYGTLIGHRCDGLFNNCDGYTFPDAAIARLRAMDQKAPQLEVFNRTARPAFP